MTTIKSNDWQKLPYEKWNASTVTAYLEHLTKENKGVTYEPTGGGSKGQRWSREKGMMKQAIEKYGAAVVKRFIDLGFEKHTPKPKYPYPSFTFMYSYMSDLWPVAEKDVVKSKKRREIAECSDSDEIDENWF